MTFALWQSFCLSPLFSVWWVISSASSFLSSAASPRRQHRAVLYIEQCPWGLSAPCVLCYHLPNYLAAGCHRKLLEDKPLAYTRCSHGCKQAQTECLLFIPFVLPHATCWGVWWYLPKLLAEVTDRAFPVQRGGFLEGLLQSWVLWDEGRGDVMGLFCKKAWGDGGMSRVRDRPVPPGLLHTTGWALWGSAAPWRHGICLESTSELPLQSVKGDWCFWVSASHPAVAQVGFSQHPSSLSCVKKKKLSPFKQMTPPCQN